MIPDQNRGCIGRYVGSAVGSCFLISKYCDMNRFRDMYEYGKLGHALCLLGRDSVFIGR